MTKQLNLKANVKPWGNWIDEEGYTCEVIRNVWEVVTAVIDGNGVQINIKVLATHPTKELAEADLPNFGKRNPRKRKSWIAEGDNPNASEMYVRSMPHELKSNQ